MSTIREEQKSRVLSCLRRGRDMANSRIWIAAHTYLGDRHVRNLIEELRCDGHLICNNQSGTGYFLADSREEIEQQYRQDMARAMSILRRMKPFRQTLMATTMPGQLSIEDLLMDEFMVMEGDYDAIAWATAQMQSDRWSDQFMEDDIYGRKGRTTQDHRRKSGD